MSPNLNSRGHFVIEDAFSYCFVERVVSFIDLLVGMTGGTDNQRLFHLLDKGRSHFNSRSDIQKCPVSGPSHPSAHKITKYMVDDTIYYYQHFQTAHGLHFRDNIKNGILQSIVTKIIIMKDKSRITLS
jgi:hypothetical protein